MDEDVRQESLLRGSKTDRDPLALLTPVELATRWRRSPRTLERWRHEGTGPAWLRLEGRVLYALQDVLAYERAQRHEPDG